MKNRNYLISLLMVSIVGISTGFYFKFIKSYTDEKLQIKTNNNIERQPNLGEIIRYMEELEAIKASAVNVEHDQNNEALKQLKTINLASIAIMMVSIIIGVGVTRTLLQKRSV